MRLLVQGIVKETDKLNGETPQITGVFKLSRQGQKSPVCDIHEKAKQLF